MDKISHHLSGGKKCRVAIATVLAMNLAPTTDLQCRRRLINFLKTSPQIWVASHHLELILEVCDRVMLLNQGQIIVDSIAKKIKNAT